MNTALRIIAGVVVAAAAVALIGYLLLLGASNAYVSGGMGTWAFEVFDSTMIGPEMYRHAQELGLPGIGQRKATFVEELNVLHAGRNLVFLFSTAAFATLFPVAVIVVGIAALVYGLVTADWSTFGMALLTPIFAVVSFIMVAVLSVLAWISLIFQPCTPGYALVMLILGAPILLFGAIFGAAPTAGTVITVTGPAAIIRG